MHGTCSMYMLEARQHTHVGVAHAHLYTHACVRVLSTDLHVTNQCFRFTLQYDSLNSDVLRHIAIY